MLFKASIVFSIVAYASAGFLGGHGYAGPLGYAGHGYEGNHYAYPKYEFNYGVADPHTGDHKSQQQVRDGDFVEGSYSVQEADRSIHRVDHIGGHAGHGYGVAAPFGHGLAGYGAHGLGYAGHGGYYGHY